MIFSADIWHSVASTALIVSLAVGAISSAVIVISGNAKEKRFKQELSQNSVELEQAKLETAKINKIAKTAELELEKLRAKLRNRSMTIKQRELLISSLSKLSGKVQISVHTLMDKESSEYGEQIISVLSDAGIDIVRSMSGSISPPKYGIIISSSSAFSDFHNAFKKANIDFTVDTNETGIFIGLKTPIDP